MTIQSKGIPKVISVDLRVYGKFIMQEIYMRKGKGRRIALFFGIMIAAWMIWILAEKQIVHAVSPFWKKIPTEKKASETSTSYRYDLAFSRTLLEYSDFRNLYRAEYSTAIPGLECTNLYVSDSDQMVPQGLCIAGDYMLISAYDKSKKENSVLYVLSNQDEANRQLLTTIVLPDQNHVGGITFDGSSLWIAKSTTKYLSEIQYSCIEEAVDSGQATYFLEDYDSDIYCGVTASFVSYQDNRLWVGTSQSFLTKEGMLSVFRMLRDEHGMELKREFTLDIPKNTQGISFMNLNDKQYLLLDVSQGRFRDSFLYLFEASVDDRKIELRSKEKYIFPPMVEELVSDGEYTYCLFESAATCYSTDEYLKCKYPVDRISAISNRLLVGEAL